jgi:hypothetical protein
MTIDGLRPRDRRFDIALELDIRATLASPLLGGFALDVGKLFDFG